MKIVLIGPHGAGKSTLGRELAERTGWTFHDEIIGRPVAGRTPRPGTADRQQGFDREVFAREVMRDAAFDADVSEGERSSPRIIEGWHPEHYAYASTRSPEIALSMFAHLRTGIDWSRVLVVPLLISPATFEARRTSPPPWSHFRYVAERTFAVAAQLGANMASPYASDETSPAELAAAVLTEIGAFARHVGAPPPPLADTRTLWFS